MKLNSRGISDRFLGAGDYFGEESLVNLRRAHTATTAEECEMIQFEVPPCRRAPRDPTILHEIPRDSGLAVGCAGGHVVGGVISYVVQ